MGRLLGKKALAVRAAWPEFDPEDSHGGGRREQTQKRQWMMLPDTHISLGGTNI